jgi:hypothetical protein
MQDAHFKFRVGDIITHRGFLYPRRQPVVQRFEIVGQTLVACPGATQRYYYIRTADKLEQQAATPGATLRVEESSLAPLPDDEVESRVA